MASNDSDRPIFDGYKPWYYRRFMVDLDSVEDWYGDVTTEGIRELEASTFWNGLQSHLNNWNGLFRLEHDNFPLFWDPAMSPRITAKPFESVLQKSFRRNVRENKDWPKPPICTTSSSTGSESDERDPSDPQWWYGPHNWLDTLPDIFRTRLTATYFDGVPYLADRVEQLSKRTTSGSPEPKFHASNDGYHAAHLRIYHDLKLRNYENSDPVPVKVQLEIQVTTTIQETINRILHRVYQEWRLNGPPKNWQWKCNEPAFSVNYLGITLHYLEGMIVIARDQKETANGN